jgi:hypothetical protein
MAGDLTFDVYVSDYKPIPGDPVLPRHSTATSSPWRATSCASSMSVRATPHRRPSCTSPTSTPWLAAT